MAQRFRAKPYNADIRPLAHIRTDISITLFKVANMLNDYLYKGLLRPQRQTLPCNMMNKWVQ